MHARLDRTKAEIYICARCYGCNAVEAVTGLHGDLIATYGADDGCAYCDPVTGVAGGADACRALAAATAQAVEAAGGRQLTQPMRVVLLHLAANGGRASMHDVLQLPRVNRSVLRSLVQQELVRCRSKVTGGADVEASFAAIAWADLQKR